jgi:hypothetical protein
MIDFEKYEKIKQKKDRIKEQIKRCHIHPINIPGSD